ncbi:MAG: universal stress protein [Elusimicrobiota bacterium]
MSCFPPKRILVAADLGASSAPALDAAKKFAWDWNADIEIVYVQPQPVIAAGPDFDGLAGSGLPAAFESKGILEGKLRKAAAGFPAQRLKLRTVQGWPPTALMEMARPERADALFMGTHGYAGLDRLLTGSVAEAVVRRAQIPVLTVPEGKALTSVCRVLAPWNARPYATRALRWARNLARSFHATLDVFYAEEPGRSIGADWAAVDRRLLSILGCGPDWTFRTRKGNARKHIIAEANSGRYQLVVLSAHRRLFASDFVLGSTVERLLRHSHVPILSVPSGQLRERLITKLTAPVSARLY